MGILKHEWVREAPPADTGGAANIVLDTLPQEGAVEEENEEQGGRGEIDAFGDFELGGEDESVPEALRGLSRDELIAKLNEQQSAIEASAKPDPIAHLGEQFSALAQALKPAAPAPVDGYKVRNATPPAPMSADEIEKLTKRLNEEFIDNPAAAARKVVAQEFGPMLVVLAENSAQQSRENVLLNAELSPIYKRYASEIEAEIAELDPLTKLKNPRVYQAAVDRAKARHFTELSAEMSQAQQEEMAAKYLGIDIEALKALKGQVGAGGAKPGAKPASATLARAGAAAAPSSASAKKVIRVSAEQRAMIAQRARALGVTPEALAASMHERGEI